MNTLWRTVMMLVCCWGGLAGGAVARGEDAPAVIPVSVRHGDFLLQAKTPQDKALSASVWLSSLDPFQWHPPQTWPPYVRELAVFRLQGKGRGQSMRLTLRQAELVDLLPPLEGLPLEQAAQVLKALGFAVLREMPPVGTVVPSPAVLLTGTAPGDEVSLWVSP